MSAEHQTIPPTQQCERRQCSHRAVIAGMCTIHAVVTLHLGDAIRRELAVDDDARDLAAGPDATLVALALIEAALHGHNGDASVLTRALPPDALIGNLVAVAALLVLESREPDDLIARTRVRLLTAEDET